MKNVVIFGGGTGLSHILSGLKLFPVNVTAIISVSDNGSSTGILKNEMKIPAVGDIATVMISMANVSEDIKHMLRYRFNENTSLNNHPIKNLLLASLYEIKGNLTDAIDILCKFLKIQGTILPISEDRLELIARYEDGNTIIGEEQITKAQKKIIELSYDKKPVISEKVVSSINNADLIIFSPGSLYTSILPHLIIPEISVAINKSKAKKMYISNLFTQPGETDTFSVSDHLNIINKYVFIDAVIANNAKMPSSIAKKYETLEQKDEVKLDYRKIQNFKIKLIADKVFYLEDGIIRHDPLKTAYLVFSYLMDEVSR